MASWAATPMERAASDEVNRVMGPLRQSTGARSFLALACLAWIVTSVAAGTSVVLASSVSGPPGTPSGGQEQAAAAGQTTPEAELRRGTSLTRDGRFADAIPHLQAARGHVADDYEASFNLGLCYVATGQSKLAIPILTDLRDSGHETAEVWNLLSQAYIAEKRPTEAFEAFEKAAALRPDNEKLYALIADACVDQQNYDLGLKVVDAGLQRLPESARLHYQRGVVLTALDRFDVAKDDFDAASRLAPGTDIGYLAAAHKDLIEWDTAGAIAEAREAIAKGKDNYILLSILGEALIRSSVNPGEPGFAEAQAALEKSVAERPSYSRSHISLGKLYLMAGRADDAIAQLEQARALDPRNPAVYSYLASAYRNKGDIAKAKSALAMLAQLNQEQIAAIRDTGTVAGAHRGGVNGVRDQ